MKSDASKLRTVRRERGVSQTALAAAVGVDQTTISDLECGKNRNPSWFLVKGIADFLGVRPEDLFPKPERGRAA